MQAITYLPVIFQDQCDVRQELIHYKVLLLTQFLQLITDITE
jgi:hypothetical protein